MKALKLYTTLFLSIFTYFGVQACSFSPDSFCASSDSDPNRIIVAGEIVSVDQDGIDIEVFHVFHGNMISNTIRIWDGTDFDCNGLFSMAASDLGAMGDSIVVNLPIIDSIENTWDVIGDYRRPEYVTKTNKLNIKNDTVTGFINGLNFAPHTRLNKFPLDEFITKLESDECPRVIVSTSEFELNKEDFIVNNPVLDEINIQVLNDLGQNRTLELISITGTKIKSKRSQAKYISLDVDDLQSGIYLLRIIADDKRAVSYKIMKQ